MYKYTHTFIYTYYICNIYIYIYISILFWACICVEFVCSSKMDFALQGCFSLKSMSTTKFRRIQ